MDVTDEYVLIKEKESTRKIFIYEVEPVAFLNYSMNFQSNIFNLYSEFLRDMNLNFQIYISNQKINTNKYIESLKKLSLKSKDKVYLSLIKKYIESLKLEMENNTVYSTKYYIVISALREQEIEIKEVDYHISKLHNIGCHTRRLQDRESINSLLYECMNKEVLG